MVSKISTMTLGHLLNESWTNLTENTTINGGTSIFTPTNGGGLNYPTTILISNLTAVDVLNTTSPSPYVAMARDWTPGVVAEYVTRVILSVLMVAVNSLVLLTLGSTSSLRTATNLVIGSLAVTDLLVGVMGPAGLLIELELVVSPLLCRLGYAGVMAFCSVSINHLLFVSVDRYILISKPLRYQSLFTKRRVWIFIGCSWTWASAISTTFLLGLSMQPDWNGRCRAELLYSLWFMIFLVVFHFALPLIIMLFVHIKIFIVARRQQEAVQNSFRNVSTADSQSEDFVEDNGVRRLSVGSCRARLRAAKLLVLPCGYFYVSWGPWFGVTLWAVMMGRMIEPHGLERFIQTLAILNSLGNPILYAVSQPVLGKAMLARLVAVGRTCKKCCAKASSLGRPFETTALVRPQFPTLPEMSKV